MGRIIATEFISIDGVFEDPGGSEGSSHGAWTFKFNRGEEGDQFKLDELMSAEAQLLGRVTYDGFAAAWPGRSGDIFSDRINSMPKYVFSHTLQAVTWDNSHVLSGDLVADIENLKATIKGDILIAGSGTLVRGLLQHELLDQLNLMTFPIILGTGKRLFDESVPVTRLHLSSTQPVGPDGVVVLMYTRAEVAATKS